MKTLKTIRLEKAVVWSLVVMFSSLQIAPAGWAATRAVPVDELQAQSVPGSVNALANAPAAPQPAPVAPVSMAGTGFVDSTAFQLNNNPLSPATPHPAAKPQAAVSMGGVAVNHTVIRDPRIYPDPTRHGPYEVKTVTDPATGRELSVSIDEHGIATVKWGNEEYKGFLDPKTNSVSIVTNDNSVWTLQFGKNKRGDLHLQTFQTRKWDTNNYSEETYTFNPEGQLVRKDWLTESNVGIFYAQDGSVIPTCFGCGGRGYRSGGTIDYVTINGKTLVSHERTWSEDDGRIFYEYEKIGGTLSASQYLMPPYRYGHSESESWYRYDGQGNLLEKNWSTHNSYGGSGFGQEVYVQINGKMLLSVSRTWQYGQSRWLLDYTTNLEAEKMMSLRANFTSFHSETYYAYDAEGNKVSEVTAWENYDQNNVRHTGGSYNVFRDVAGLKTWTYVSAQGIDPSQVWSNHDYSVIEAAAQRKTVYVGGNGAQWNYTGRVEYTRNADGTMTAKAVYDNNGYVSFIVVGQPDLLSGETDDVKFQNGQQVNGQNVYYQEYWHADANGKWVSDGYRLVFFDQNSNATAVDFPAQDSVTLNGVSYKITIDQNGQLTLDQINALPPEVQTYVDDLQKQVGAGFKVTATLQNDGSYLVTVTDSKLYCQGPGCGPASGELKELSFTLQGLTACPAGANSTCKTSYVFDSKSLQVAYYGAGGQKNLVVPDAQLLFEGMKLLQPGASDQDALALMTQITVSKVDGTGGVYFEKGGRYYQVYRDATGIVILKDGFPPAVQAVLDEMQARFGNKYLFITYSLYGRYSVLMFRDNSSGNPATAGALAGWSIGILADGTFDPNNFQATYYDQNLNVIAAKGTLLPEGLKQMKGVSSDMEALDLMVRITVNGVDADGTIHFTKDGVNYKIYRDANGNAQLEVELFLLPNYVLKPAQANLSAVAPASLTETAETSKSVETDNGRFVSLAAWKTRSMPSRKVSGNAKAFGAVSSLKPVSAALHQSVWVDRGQRNGAGALFGFEQGSLLLGNILAELTK